MSTSSPRDHATPLVRGQLFLARFIWLRAHHGEESVDAVLSQLTAAEREPLRGVDRQGWYAWASFVHLDQAIARLFAPHDPLIFERLGAASATQRTEWLGEHASLVSVHAFLSRVAEDHHEFQNFGRAEYRRSGFEEAEIELSDYPVAYESYCRSALGFIRAAVELLARAPAQVEEPLCQARGDACCRFKVRWSTASVP